MIKRFKRYFTRLFGFDKNNLYKKIFKNKSYYKLEMTDSKVRHCLRCFEYEYWKKDQNQKQECFDTIMPQCDQIKVIKYNLDKNSLKEVASIALKMETNAKFYTHYTIYLCPVNSKEHLTPDEVRNLIEKNAGKNS